MRINKQELEQNLQTVQSAVQHSSTQLAGAISERRVEINFGPVVTAFQQETTKVLASVEDSLWRPLKKPFEEMLAAIKERTCEAEVQVIVDSLERQQKSEAEVLKAIQQGIGQLSDIISASACSCYRNSSVPTVRLSGGHVISGDRPPQDPSVPFEASPP